MSDDGGLSTGQISSMTQSGAGHGSGHGGPSPICNFIGNPPPGAFSGLSIGKGVLQFLSVDMKGLSAATPNAGLGVKPDINPMGKSI